WSHSLNNLAARTDAQVRGNIHAIRKDGPQPIPLVGDIHASYDGRSDQIAFSRSSVQMPHTNVTLNGTVSRTSALDVQMQTTDLAEIETVANFFHPLEPLGLSGSASFAGSVSGTTATPQIAGRL